MPNELQTVPLLADINLDSDISRNESRNLDSLIAKKRKQQNKLERREQ
jgi:hypothetical protein